MATVLIKQLLRLLRCFALAAVSLATFFAGEQPALCAPLPQPALLPHDSPLSAYAVKASYIPAWSAPPLSRAPTCCYLRFY